MAHQIPTGRKASDEARSRAAELVATYGPTIPAKEAALAVLAAWEQFVETGWLPDPSGECSHVGRRASDEARDAATKLLNAYGPALSSLSGTFCVNPEADPEDQVVVSADQAAYALHDAMIRLAETGWLVETEVKLEKFLMRQEFMALRRTSPTTKAAIEKLAERHHRSSRDVERLVSKKKS